MHGPGSRYCDRCGLALPAADVAADTPSRFRSPSGYTPARLAQRILLSRAAIEGERKQVTVLFADIKGSMELLAGRDPEQARALLDPVLELMMEAVHAFDGIVNQVMGDGIMALFGAPIALEDHALRGGLAALRMLELAARRTEGLHGPDGQPVRIRIGLNSGDVVVRSIGSDLDMDYTAVGQTTHVAARLEQMAEPGTALCAAATWRLAEGALRVHEPRAVVVKGLAEAVEVAELVGVERTRMRFHAAAARGLTPFVGRHAERAAIVQALERAVAGQGQVISLVGEPGIGKSRIVWEVMRSSALRDWLVLHSGAASYAAGMPYLPVRSLLQAYFEISHAEPPAQALERVTDRLAALDADLGGVATPLLALLELPVDDARWTRLEPVQRRQETNEAVRRLLFRESESRPVLVVVEDLHWTDRETEALLDALVERLAPTRLALMVNARPEYQHAWSSRASVLQLRVNPLDLEHKQALLAELLGPGAGFDPLVAAIAERTGGNPFYIEECVRSLVEAGVIAGQPGRYQVVRPGSALQVPPSVQAVIAARIDRLAPDDKHLLQAAAVIGPLVPMAILGVMPSAAKAVGTGGLQRLAEAEFVHESRIFPELEYAFTHALTCEVADAGLLQEQRRTLHAEIAEAIERAYPQRLEEHVERLAYHAIRGESWAKAVAWARSAAAKAAARSAYREALAFFEQALEAVARLPEDESLLAVEIDLRIEMRAVLFPLREIARDLDNLRAAEPLAERLGDRHRQTRLLTLQTRDLSILGHARRAMECGKRALSLAEQVGDLELKVLANAYLGSVCVARGEYREAVEILTRGTAVFRGRHALARFGLPGPAAVIFRVWLVTALTRLGEFEAATREVARSLAAARKADQPLALLVARYTNGFLLAHQGRLAEAIVELQTSLELCRSWRLPAWFSNIASVLGWAQARSGRIDEGVALMREAIDASVSGGGMVNHSSEVARLADAMVLQGRWPQARELALQAVELARRHEERGNEAIALRLLGDIERHVTGNDAAGAGHLRAAIEISTELGMRPLLASMTAADLAA